VLKHPGGSFIIAALVLVFNWGSQRPLFGCDISFLKPSVPLGLLVESFAVRAL